MSDNEIQEKNLQEDLEQALLSYSKAEEEIVHLKDQLIRLAAENENVRKRLAKQVEDASKFAVSGFAKDLIEVLENLYLATNAMPMEALDDNSGLSSVFKGVEMTKTTLLNVFEKHGIKRIYPDTGDEFNHDLHEAVAHVDNADLNENSIVSVMRAGYSLHERLIKPAMVVVSKSKVS